jgi:hypothetical protein
MTEESDRDRDSDKLKGPVAQRCGKSTNRGGNPSSGTVRHRPRITRLCLKVDGSDGYDRYGAAADDARRWRGAAPSQLVAAHDPLRTLDQP